MHPRYATYILESRWSWDHSNTEIASIVIEGVEGERYEQELEIILKPDCPKDIKDSIMTRLKTLADFQNSCQMPGDLELVRLWRLRELTGEVPPAIHPYSFKKGKLYNMNMKLELVCDFKGNKPVAPCDKED